MNTYISTIPFTFITIVASCKGENGLAVGNVVGSNNFNILFILGVSATIHPITVNYASVIDLLILIVVFVITFVYATRKSINRIQGASMVIMYIATVVFAILR